MMTSQQKGLLVLLPVVGYLALRASAAISANSVPEESHRLPRHAVSRPYVAIERLIRRDPFAGAPRPLATTIPSAVSRGMPSVVSPEMRLGDLDDIPIDGASADPRPSVRAYVVKATIVGIAPVAYVTTGDTMEIVRLGDRLGARRVVSIDATGLRLDDGTRLELAVHPASGTPHASRTPPHPRRLPSAVRRKNGDVSTAPAEPPQRSAEQLPTPGTLPTIRPGAFPLGSRPTSDPNAPTAFPYPYPYPPPR